MHIGILIADALHPEVDIAQLPANILQDFNIFVVPAEHILGFGRRMVCSKLGKKHAVVMAPRTAIGTPAVNSAN